MKESEPTPPEKEFVEYEEKKEPYISPPPYKSPIFFLRRFTKAKIEAQFKKFVERLKKLYINLPSIKGISQMTTCVKFLKDILSNRRKLEDSEIVAMIIDSIAVI